MEEYKALRAESLRCAGTTSNTLWLGITQFSLTLGAWAIFARDSIEFYLPLLIILEIESLAASCIYLGELWKYARVGHYIREKIENQILIYDTNNDIRKRPLFWENWIINRRVKWIYVFSLAILQIPFLISLTGFALFVSINFCSEPFMNLAFLIILLSMDPFPFLWAIFLIIFTSVDALMVIYMINMIKRIGRKGDSGLADNFEQPQVPKPKCD